MIRHVTTESGYSWKLHCAGVTVLSCAVLVLNFTEQCPCDLAGATELACLTLAAGLIEHQHSWLQGKLIETIPTEEPGECQCAPTLDI